MAFTEADRVQIRKYLGFANLWLQADARLESAITASQSTADGGTRPTSDAENDIKANVTQCQAVDAAIVALRDAEGAGQVDEIKIDTAREHARLVRDGTMYATRIARALDVSQFVNAWTGGIERIARLNDQYPFVRSAY